MDCNKFAALSVVVGLLEQRNTGTTVRLASFGTTEHWNNSQASFLWNNKALNQHAVRLTSFGTTEHWNNSQAIASFGWNNSQASFLWNNETLEQQSGYLPLEQRNTGTTVRLASFGTTEHWNNSQARFLCAYLMQLASMIL